eukprot:9711031-Ditylum_brightwellii.AAC.1
MTTIELDNVLCISSAPKNLISISQWSEERKDDRGILTRCNYSIFLWNNDESQKLVPHPINCRIPMLQAHEGGETEFDRFQKKYESCLHDQFCMLATGSSAGSHYVGIEKRDPSNTLILPNSLPDTDESEVDQQPTNLVTLIQLG